MVSDSQEYSVWYPRESDSLRSQLSNPGKISKKFNSPGEFLIKIENILNRWSVAQVGSNEEKKLEVENLVGLSL